MGLHAQEVFINRDEGYRFGDSGVYETRAETRGELYRMAQEEYGRCEGKVYIDTPDGAKAIGWVFVGKARYEDTGEPYLREVWVTVHTAQPTTTIEHHYDEMEA